MISLMYIMSDVTLVPIASITIQVPSTLNCQIVVDTLWENAFSVGAEYSTVSTAGVNLLIRQ